MAKRSSNGDVVERRYRRDPTPSCVAFQRAIIGDPLGETCRVLGRRHVRYPWPTSVPVCPVCRREPMHPLKSWQSDWWITLDTGRIRRDVISSVHCRWCELRRVENEAAQARAARAAQRENMWGSMFRDVDDIFETFRRCASTRRS